MSKSWECRCWNCRIARSREKLREAELLAAKIREVEGDAISVELRKAFEQQNDAVLAHGMGVKWEG